MAAPSGLAPKVLQRPLRPPTHQGLAFAPTAGSLPDRTRTRAPPIPKSDERFARQYRCGPPPEFPLASPRSGIVHHLSGPDSLGRNSPPRGATGSGHNRALTLSDAPFQGTWAVAAMAKRVELQPLLAAMSVDVDLYLGQQRARGAREASIHPATTACLMIEARCEGGDSMRDAQADVPST
ncbi:hypothetical protein CQW23_33280 [Capsicum baccatum]|uniref:Uncharacterized protein n=1 Tax=Capsicum baccatum TaxID=33114 RepID=A0A2G2V2C5_CAPBA|nr:hypothetical protein CQW23_33280 [Capsicum baccatum]